MFLLLVCDPCRNVVLLMCRHLGINILELPISLACGCWASQWQPDVGIRMPRPARFGKQKTPSRPERSVLLRVGLPNTPGEFGSLLVLYCWVSIGSSCLPKQDDPLLSHARYPALRGSALSLQVPSFIALVPYTEMLCRAYQQRISLAMLPGWEQTEKSGRRLKH